MKRGHFTLLVGPMFSWKTADLAERANGLRAVAGKDVLVVMPKIDTRRSEDHIVSLSGAKTPAIQISHPHQVLEMVATNRPNYVFFDEVHFVRVKEKRDGVEGWAIVFAIQDLLRIGIDVWAAGLDTNFLTQPFPPTTDLMGVAADGDVIRKRAICNICGSPADWTLRLLGGEPVGPGAPLIVVGGIEGEEGRGKVVRPINLAAAFTILFCEVLVQWPIAGT